MVSCGQRNRSPQPYSWFSIPVSLIFLPSRSSRGWVDPIPDPLLLRKFGSTGNWTQDLWICSQELWPLNYSGSLNVCHLFSLTMFHDTNVPFHLRIYTNYICIQLANFLFSVVSTFKYLLLAACSACLITITSTNHNCSARHFFKCHFHSHYYCPTYIAIFKECDTCITTESHDISWIIAFVS
jgi:hypothetical protein